MSPYNNQYYNEINRASLSSAGVIVPLLLQLTSANSVVDMGCGDGTWLSVFHSQGVERFLGIDGEYVRDDQLKISPSNFKRHNLNEPFVTDHRFDLAVSLEVAEHLNPAAGPEFVSGLVRLAPVVAFSAAIPHQEGLHHINERWQSYWAELFAAHNYLAIDAIRPKVWGDKRVEWWYAQNLIIYAQPSITQANPRLCEFISTDEIPALNVVHPDLYTYRQWLLHRALRPRLFEAIAEIPRAVRRSIRSRFKLAGQ